MSASRRYKIAVFQKVDNDYETRIAALEYARTSCESTWTCVFVIHDAPCREDILNHRMNHFSLYPQYICIYLSTIVCRRVRLRSCNKVIFWESNTSWTKINNSFRAAEYFLYECPVYICLMCGHFN